MATQKNRKMLHRKEPQMMSPSITASAAGTFIVKDPLGIRRTALFVASATVQRLYDINEDSWQPLPSFAMAGTFAAGACGTWGLWSDTYTVISATPSSVTIALRISQFVVGKTIWFQTGGNALQRFTASDFFTDPISGESTIYFVEELPVVPLAGDTFQVDSGRYWILNAYTSLASGVFKTYDILSGTVSIKSNAGLPASWGTDAKLVATPSYAGAYASGTATVAGENTLSNAAKSWTVNAWSSYQVRITSGTGTGQVRTIASNTNDTVTVTQNWTTVPDQTSQYVFEGNDDYLYLLGNASVNLYRYSLTTNSWSLVTPSVARAAAPNVGMGANWIIRIGDAHWADESHILDGRFIYSFAGNATSVLHRYDIALNKWETVTYLRASETFTTGSSYDVEKGKIYIRKDAAGRFYYYDIVGNQLIPFTQDFFPDSTAVVGDKMFSATYNDGTGDDIDFLYYLLNSSTVFRRIMIY